MHVLPEINFLHLILPVTLLLLGGWMTPTPSQGPPIPQGGGGMMGYDHDHGRGGGGGTRNLEHIYGTWKWPQIRDSGFGSPWIFRFLSRSKTWGVGVVPVSGDGQRGFVADVMLILVFSAVLLGCYEGWRDDVFRLTNGPLPEFLRFSHLKMDGWNTIVSFWVSACFQGANC